MIDLKYAREQFERYLDGYDREDEKIKLKIVHTYGVVDCARKIATGLHLPKEDCELAEIIALLHDIGRFEQIKQFDSFEPTTMDHAAYGVEVLFGQENMIRRFVADDTWDEIIRAAIEKHSDFKIEGITDERMLLHAKLIRDADKLDNCRVKLEDSVEVMVGETEEQVGSEKISSKVWESCMRHEAVKSPDRVEKIDYWVSYIAYFFDMYFPATFQLVRENDFVSRIIGRITYTDDDTKVKMNQLETMVNDYVTRMSKEKC